MIGRCAVTAIQGVLDHRSLDSVKPRAVNQRLAGRHSDRVEVHTAVGLVAAHVGVSLRNNPLLGRM